jgi:hypothetical protein
MNLKELFKPIGWTRKSNVDGYLAGTYDVIALWHRGPEIEPWSNVALYTEDQVKEIVELVQQQYTI